MAKQKARTRLVQKRYSPRPGRVQARAKRATRIAAAVDVGGRTIKAQAARLDDRRVPAAQRQAVAAHIGRAQGNAHVQRVVNAVQAAHPKPKVVRRRDYVEDLVNALTAEHINQSNGAKPIRPTKQVLRILRKVVSLSEGQILLLWHNAPPKYSQDVVRLVRQALPANVPQSTVQALNAMRFAAASRPVVTKGGQPTSPGKGPKTPMRIEEQEALFKALARVLHGKGPEEKSAGTEALKNTLSAFFETKQGKALKKRVMKLLLSKKGLPITVAAIGGALAGMIAKNTDIPSTPEIQIKDVSIKIEFEGTMRNIKGAKLIVKFPFGGPRVEKVGKKKRTVLALPPALHAYIDRIDDRMLIKWFQAGAFYAWESAGPEWEDKAQAFYQAARDKPEALGLPGTRLTATRIARELVGAAIQNRIKQLEGKPAQKRLTIDLKHTDHFDSLVSLKGLAPRLEWLVNLLVPKVPFKALGIEQLTFKCGTKHPPVSVQVKKQ